MSQHCVPPTRPISFAAFPGALQRIKNAIGISNLIEGCRPLAITPARTRVLRITFELLDLLVSCDVSEQPASDSQ